MEQVGTGWSLVRETGGTGTGSLQNGWNRMRLEQGGLQIRWNRV